MLVQLEIHNVALIDNVSIEMGKGLNILTGETGAGKSIIIDSIGAILGERLSKDLIRTGKEKASVEAVFHLENERIVELLVSMGIEPEEDGTLIISREFSLSGKNTCRINGKMSTVSMLKEIGEKIIDVHGQFDNQSLLRTESHIDLLDSFGGYQIQKIRQDYINLLTSYREIKNKLRSITGDKNERERKIDLLKYQIDEIRKAKLKKNEEDELNKQRVILSSSEKILSALSKTFECLYSDTGSMQSAIDGINEAVSHINGIAKIDKKYGELAKRLEDLSYQLDDITAEIRSERDGVEYNPDLLEQIEERIDIIYRLKKKYGNSIDEILAYCKGIEHELDELNKSEEIIEKLNKQLEDLENELLILAVKLDHERREAAGILENKISDELEDLEMKRAKFKVNVELDDAPDLIGVRKFSHNGLNKVEFLISPNAGEPLKPLAKIASGGEMSRVMLAIKNILADVDMVPTLIFDEIDIGISGRAAQKVGEKLSLISRSHQVLCVTHLAQIAAMADCHFLIEKVTEDDKTHTLVSKLMGKAVDEEVARILGGANISEITLKHAREMIRNAKQVKQ